MIRISTFRLNLLRAGYLLLVIGLGLTIWPGVLNPARSWALMHGVVVAMLAALSLLAVLGLRYPLQMLPLLFFEVTWKAIWLARVALPLWFAHRMDADTAETAYECALAVILLAIVPWSYVFETYVKKAGDPWGGAALKNLLASGRVSS
jgi:hypothetical protein